MALTFNNAKIRVMSLLMRRTAGMPITTGEKRILAYLNDASVCGQTVWDKKL